MTLHKRLSMTCICWYGNAACCRICTCPRTGERGNQRDLSLHKRLLMTCICRCGNRACCRICTCPRTGRRRVNQRDLPTMIVPAVTTMPQNNGPHARTHAPGHAEQPVQVGQTHLSFHSWRAEAHHRLHAALAVLLVGAVTASCTPAFLIEEIPSQIFTYPTQPTRTRAFGASVTSL